MQEQFKEIFDFINNKDNLTKSNSYQIAHIKGKVHFVNPWGGLICHVRIKQLIEQCHQYMNQVDDSFIFDYNTENDSYKIDAAYQKYIQDNRPVPLSNKLTYIYLMLNKRNGLVKIGKSNNPQVREKTLQSEEPEIELILSTLNGAETEKVLHMEYASQRVRGEWFSLSEKDIQEIKEMLGEAEPANIQQ